MILILAFIGVAVILLFLGKFLVRAGTYLEGIEDAVATRQANLKRTGITRPRAENIKEKTLAAKGEGTDAEYVNRIQAEIEEITGN